MRQPGIRGGILKRKAPIKVKIRIGPMTRKPKPEFLAEKFLTEIGKGRSILSFDEGQAVFAQGEPANSIFYIQKGKVKLTVVSEQGKEAVIAMLGTRDFFGEGCLTVQPLRMATATAMSECSIMRLEIRRGRSAAQGTRLCRIAAFLHAE